MTVPDDGSRRDMTQGAVAREDARDARRAGEVSARRAGIAAYVWGVVRLGIGWIFLWAFLDKCFGLGHETESKNSWINGGSPTNGFLSNAATGPFKDLYNDIAGDTWADWMFMLGLLGIGAALMLGIVFRFGVLCGVVMLILMWTAVLPPDSNPFLDDHLIYAATLIGLALVGAEDTLGLGRLWGRVPIVQRWPWLK
jgi:thiosulfate dehydrogenase [quinone] large subunit